MNYNNLFITDEQLTNDDIILIIFAYIIYNCWQKVTWLTVIKTWIWKDKNKKIYLIEDWEGKDKSQNLILTPSTQHQPHTLPRCLYPKEISPALSHQPHLPRDAYTPKEISPAPQLWWINGISPDNASRLPTTPYQPLPDTPYTSYTTRPKPTLPLRVFWRLWGASSLESITINSESGYEAN